MLDWLKNTFIGKSREEELSPYANALNSASSNYNTAVQWNKNAKDYLANHEDIDKGSSLYQTLSQIAADDFTDQYKNQLDEYQGYWDKAKKQQQYNIFGSGLIGSGLNDAFQSGTALWDLGESGTDKWKRGERDAVSDAGAGLNTLLNAASVATLGAGLTGGLAAKPATTTLKQAVGKGALAGAGWGGVGTLGNYLKTAGNEATLGDALTTTGVGAGLGALVGGSASGAGYGLGRLTSSVDKQAISNALSDYAKTGGRNEYQQALATLQNYGVDTSTEDALNKTVRKAMINASKTGEGADVNSITTALNAAKNKLTEGDFSTNMAKATAPVAELDLSSIPRVPAANWQEALTNAKNNIQASPLMNNRLVRDGVQLAPAGGAFGGAYLLSRFGRKNNNQTLQDYYATLGQE